MHRIALLLSLAVLAALALTFNSEAQEEGQDPMAELTALYHAAFESGETEALAAGFAQHSGLALLVIDADLEGSLALREENLSAENEAQALERIARAEFGAAVASRALHEPIFSDYAVSFGGWSEVQRLNFRAGQKAFGEARGALREGDLERAHERANRSLELAEPLGDWWGTAMALGARADALIAAEEHTEALIAASRARLLHHQLGLESSQLGDLLRMADAALGLQRFGRALNAMDAAQGLADRQTRSDWQGELLARRAAALEGLGRTAEAAAVRAELAALEQGE